MKLLSDGDKWKTSPLGMVIAYLIFFWRHHLSFSEKGSPYFSFLWDKLMAAGIFAGVGDGVVVSGERAGLGECRTSIVHPLSSPIVTPMYHHSCHL